MSPPTMSAGKISLSLSGPKKPAPANGVKRSHAAFRDQDEDGQDEGQAQDVTHFDRAAGGAVDEKRPTQDKGPMVIASQKNRDWKEASVRNKKARYAQVADAERGGNGGITEADVERSKPTYGLNIASKKEESNEDEEAAGQESENATPNDTAEVSQQPRTADEEAMDALLGKEKESTLVLPAMSEDQAFDRDYKTAPDMASLEDYDRVPVEEFGAAMLRGMGWKDGEGIGAERGKKAVKTNVPKRRPALLGIGAKEEAAVADEMGAWGKAARANKGGEVKIYNPVLLKDKKTGEMFTEAEAEKRKQKEERERYEMEFEEAERKKKDKEGERNGGRKRESSRERKERKERDRRKYDDSDEEYYRRKKEKERRRRDREREENEYYRDRERSRKQDGEREKRRDDDRIRDQERHRERRR
ncbi:DNA primase large subunit Spp2 [Saxophila tyrrhenica]|uniref:Pre-mRNA-splicing factor n=1 Tax=Saxophila tyrrhenica TaxID=1690608 RepID=A0AAV9PIA3_9PEZI|nr:DNA primase large subunit Spp2 [Saxophila tyrrhenica]